jgi:ABC-type Co2+ transport system permease subunit
MKEVAMLYAVFAAGWIGIIAVTLQHLRSTGISKRQARAVAAVIITVAVLSFVAGHFERSLVEAIRPR